MVTVHGTRTSEDEFEAAQDLRAAILREEPALEHDEGRRVEIIVSAKTPSYRGVKDIDLVLLAHFDPPFMVRTTVDEHGTQDVAVYSLAMTIEVKNHRGPDMRVRDNKLEVRYKNEWADAWEQADKQKFALQHRVETISGKRPFVSGFAWLRQATEDQLKAAGAREPHPYLCGTFSLSALCRRMMAIDHPHRASSGRFYYSVLRDNMDIDAVIKAMTREELLTGLDRKRIEQICKREVAKHRFEGLGTVQYLITGRGGTGKTVYLLRLAQRLYVQRKRVLVLTYNIALVTDLRRQLQHIGLRDDSSERAVRVQTLHAFFIAALLAFDIIAPGDISERWFSDDYGTAVGLLRDAIRDLTAQQIDAVIAAHFSELGWHYVCVDEGQDWGDAERDVLHLLYQSSHCIIADGNDQLVRQQTRCDWAPTKAIDDATSVIDLKKSLRMKNRIATFANRFAKRMGLEWSVDPEEQVVGGNVILLLTPPELHLALIAEKLAECEASGHNALDTLFCVPHEDIISDEQGERRSKLGLYLEGHMNGVWDAVDRDERMREPGSADDVRIVQYDSCRGLEGWLVVAKDFDLFYDAKYRQWRPSHQQTFTFDERYERALAASRWSMIPVTRAIDTLVISFYDRKSRVAKAMLDVAAGMVDSVTIID